MMKRGDIWDTVKRCNCSSRKREERKWTEAIFEEIMVENFSNFGRTTLQNLGLWAPIELMQRKSSFRHITAISGYWRQREILKAFRGVERQRTLKQQNQQLTSEGKQWESQDNWAISSKWWKKITWWT